MLSMAAMGRQSRNYYLQLANQDYYLKGGEPPGIWLGQRATTLGLSGTVDRDAFWNVFRGFSPDGTTGLVQNPGKLSTAGRKGHHPGWDLTFSAPKSVSILWGTSAAPTRKTIEACHLAAVKDVISYLEDTALETKRGRAGEERERVNGLLGAAFLHGTSRARDPQLHTHLLVMNLAQRTDGTWGTIVGRPLFQEKMTAGAIYRSSLAARLQHELAIAIEPTKEAFELSGVPESVRRLFSTRRKEIEEELRAMGDSRAPAAAEAALRTRKHKSFVPRVTLHAEWKKVAASAGFEPEMLRPAPCRKLYPKDINRALAAAVERAVRLRSDFTESDLLRHLSRETIGQGLNAAALREQARRHLAEGSFSVTGQGREARYTVQAAQRSEKQLLALLASLKKRKGIPVSGKSLLAAKEHLSRQGLELSESQDSFLRQATLGQSALGLLPALSRSDLTVTMEAARHAWERKGYDVFAISPSAGGAQELQFMAGLQAKTPTNFLSAIRPRTHGETFRIMRGLEKKRGISFFSIAGFLKYATAVKTRQAIKLTDKSVVVVDRADSVSTAELIATARAVYGAGGHLVLLQGRKSAPAGSVFDSIVGAFGSTQEQPHSQATPSKQAPGPVTPTRQPSPDKSLAEKVLEHLAAETQRTRARDRTPTRQPSPDKSLADKVLEHLAAETQRTRARDRTPTREPQR